MSKPTLAISHPSFSGLIGVARADITPPVGIYSRMWGSALHDVAEGIHRPLTATAMTFRPEHGGDPLVLVALDLGWWRTEEDEWFIRGPLLEEFKLDPARLMINLSHTHAGPCVSLSAGDKPGGEMIEPYMRRVREAVITAVQNALKAEAPSMLSWATARCDLARNRQWPDPGSGRVVIGFNPDMPADDTVVVGRVTSREGGHAVGALVNYACHPTTLGGTNRWISPDYIGAMREVVEQAIGGAPCLYLHGAAGDLGPRRQYVGDSSVADSHGRQLGHAAAGALEGMLPHARSLAYTGIERSGTDLGRWDLVDATSVPRLDAEILNVELPLKRMPPAEELAARLRQCTDRVTAERLERAVMLRTRIGDQSSKALPVWLWRLGDCIFLGTQSEAHSPLQVELRRRFPDLTIAVMNVVNGYASYLPPAHEYDADSYQAQVALFDRGGLERMISVCGEAIERWVGTNDSVRR